MGLQVLRKFNKIGQVAFALALDPQNDRNIRNIDSFFFDPLFWAQETLKRTFPLKTQNRIFSITKLYFFTASNGFQQVYSPEILSRYSIV